MTSSTPSMKRYTTTEYGKQNIFAAEPEMRMVENYQGYWENAEQLNGRMAMIGFFAAVHNYILFGAVIPGIFQRQSRSLTPLQLQVLSNPKIQSNERRKTMTPEAEKFNGWMAMIGIVAALGAYSFTGQIIPGIF